MEDDIENKIDHYRIINQLGGSAYSTVFKAFDTRLEREVALKLIHKESFPLNLHERLLNLIELEVKPQTELNHRHIVPIYDYGDKEGSPYLVMDYFSRGSLKAYAGQPYPHQEVVSLLIPILDALSFAHEHRMIHQNIKPSNILIDEEGQLHLSDFGIANIIRLIDQSLTGSSFGLGTPEYMAPEQFNGQSIEASDQYAIGVVFYELLTGQKPYTAETPQAVRMIQSLRAVVSISSLNSEVPVELDRIILKSLAREPDQRYKDVTLFKKALGKFSSIDIVDVSEDTETEESTVEAPYQHEQPDIDLIPVLEQETRSNKGIDLITTEETRIDPTHVKKEPINREIEQEKTTLPTWAILTGWATIIIVSACLILSVVNAGKNNPIAFIVEPIKAAFFVRNTQTPEILERPETSLILTASPSNTIEFTNTPTHTLTITPTFTSTEILLKAHVIVENALLRSGPDFSHPIISERLNLNSNLSVTSKTPSEYWFYIITEDGLEGWLFTDWIELDVPIDLIPTEQFIPTSPIIFTATSQPISTPIPPQENTPAPTKPPQYP